MRNAIAAGVALAVLAVPSHALAQGFASLEAINRCEAFVEDSVRPELAGAFRQAYKITCYFALVDSQIHEDHEAVCARISRALAVPHREIADFVCRGTYRTWLAEQDQP